MRICFLLRQSLKRCAKCKTKTLVQTPSNLGMLANRTSEEQPTCLWVFFYLRNKCRPNKPKFVGSKCNFLVTFLASLSFYIRQALSLTSLHSPVHNLCYGANCPLWCLVAKRTKAWMCNTYMYKYYQLSHHWV